MSISQVIEDVANWADQKNVDYAIFRDEWEWTVQLKFSDARGPFSSFLSLPDTNTGRLEKQLDALCVKARRDRMKQVAYGKAA